MILCLVLHVRDGTELDRNLIFREGSCSSIIFVSLCPVPCEKYRRQHYSCTSLEWVTSALGLLQGHSLELFSLRRTVQLRPFDHFCIDHVHWVLLGTQHWEHPYLQLGIQSIPDDAYYQSAVPRISPTFPASQAYYYEAASHLSQLLWNKGLDSVLQQVPGRNSFPNPSLQPTTESSWLS